MLVRLQSPPGTSETKMSGLTAQVSRELGAIPGVEDVGGHVGRALTGIRSSTSTPAPSLSRSAPTPTMTRQ